MSSTVAHIRFNEHEMEFLNRVVSERRFNSKSDAIKTALRLMEFDSLVNEISSKFKKPNNEELLKTIKEIRRENYKKTFGNTKNKF